LSKAEKMDDAPMEKIVIDLALAHNKRLKDLTEEDFKSDRFAAELLKKRPESFRDLALLVQTRLIERIERGATTRSGQIFLHTEPHHDDLMLGYLPAMVRNIRDASNSHYFATLTGGFTAVTNAFMLRHLRNLKRFLDRSAFAPMMKDGYFDPANILGRNRDIWQYLDGLAADDPAKCEEGEARRLLRNLVEIFEESSLDNLRDRIDELISYFETQYPGKKDLPYIQLLKGMMREWEADCLWGYFGFDASSVMHVRLGFYKGEIFSEEPTIERDVRPILQVLKRTKPTIVSTTLDPEGAGPDTHYKVMQAITEALKQYEKQEGRSDIEVWGYRNVWYRFHPAEANIYVPVSLNMFSVLDSAFKRAFVSQRDASFPSYEHDGPFSELAQKIQVEQYAKLKTCLGREFFYEHPSPLLRATRGLVFIKSMSLKEFYAHSRELQRRTENV
jgi:glucosamine-6-phosphate deaminase